MTEGKVEFKAILEDLLLEQSQSVDPLTPEELVAWREGKLGDAERSVLEKRLLLDRDAVSSLLSNEASNSAETISPEQSEASWLEIERKLSNPEGPTVVPQTTLKKPLRDPEQAKPSIWLLRITAIAAIAFGLIALVLGLRLASVIEERNSLFSPSLQVTGDEIYLGEEVTRSQNIIFKLSQGQAFYRLGLSRKWDDYRRWQVNIIDPLGELIFSETNEAKKHALYLSLNAKYFSKAGVYRVDIAGMKNGKPVPLDSFDLTIEPH